MLFRRWLSISTAPSALAALTALGALGTPAQAADGLSLAALRESAEWLWPRLQARVTVQTASVGPSWSSALTAPAASRSLREVQGAALFGDVVLYSQPTLGSFRATSGVLLGNASGAPVLGLAGAGGRVGLTVLDGGLAAAGESPHAMPYLGLGYSSPLLWGGFSLSADVGLVAGRAAGLADVGRALFGSPTMDLAVREMRLSPMLQLGVRYAF